jgi:hypothetical protein
MCITRTSKRLTWLWIWNTARFTILWSPHYQLRIWSLHLRGFHIDNIGPPFAHSLNKVQFLLLENQHSLLFCISQDQLPPKQEYRWEQCHKDLSYWPLVKIGITVIHAEFTWSSQMVWINSWTTCKLLVRLTHASLPSFSPVYFILLSLLRFEVFRISC